MRKIQILVLALVSVLACTALVTASASAALTFELALWLINGADLTAEHLSNTEGELLFENALNGAHFTCSGLFEGTIGPESLDLVTMVYSLGTSQKLIENLAGEALLCTAENCTSPEVWPVELPWLTEVEQDSETGLFYELTFGAQYHLACSVLGIKVEELCEAPGTEAFAAEVLNVAAGVEAMGEVTPLATCNGTTGEGRLASVAGNLTTSPDGTVSISLP